MTEPTGIDMTKICPMCEQGAIELVLSQKPWPYKGMDALVPAWPIAIPTCNNCYNSFLGRKEAEAIDEALEVAYKVFYELK